MHVIYINLFVRVFLLHPNYQLVELLHLVDFDWFCLDQLHSKFNDEGLAMLELVQYQHGHSPNFVDDLARAPVFTKALPKPN